MNDTLLDPAHDRRRTDDLDWASILIGTLNPKTGKNEGGLVDSVARLVEFVAFQRQVDSWLLRLMAIILVAKFLGAERLWDLVKIVLPS